MRDARETFETAPPGSHMRFKILELVMSLMRAKHLMGMDRDDMETCTDEELRAIIQRELAGKIVETTVENSGCHIDPAVDVKS